MAVVHPPRIRRERSRTQKAIEVRLRFQIAWAAGRADLAPWKVSQSLETLLIDWTVITSNLSEMSWKSSGCRDGLCTCKLSPVLK